MSKKYLSKISKIYATSLFGVGKAENLVQEFYVQLKQVIETVQSSNDLQIVMGNSSITISNKLDIISSVFENKIESKLLSFLKLLIEKDRFNELDSVFESYKLLVDENSNKKIVEIVSAIDVSDEKKSQIIMAIEKKINSNVIPVWMKDENIIAGLVIKFDDYVIDSSVQTKIRNLSKNMSV